MTTLHMTKPSVLVAAAGMLCASAALADTFDVPGDFATFDEAVAAASDGDTIRLLQPNLLSGLSFIDLDGKALTVERVGGPLRTDDNALLTMPNGSGIVVASGAGLQAPGTNRVEADASVMIFTDRIDQIGDLIVAPRGRLDLFLGTDARIEETLRLDEGAVLDIVVAESSSDFEVEGFLDLRPGSRLTLDPQSTLRALGPLRTDGATLWAQELVSEGAAEFVASTVRLDRLERFGESPVRFIDSDTRIETGLQGNTSLEIVGGTFFARSNDGFQSISMLDADVFLVGPLFNSSDLRVERSRLEIGEGDLLDVRGATIEDSHLVADQIRAGSLQEPGAVPIRRTSITSFQIDFFGDAIGSGDWFGEVRNQATLIVDDATNVFGRFDNVQTTIVRGDLTVFGTFNNSGDVIGEIDALPAGRAAPPALRVFGDTQVGSRGRLSMPAGALLDLAGPLSRSSSDPEQITLDGVTVRIFPRNNPGAGGPNGAQLGGGDALAQPAAFDGTIPGTSAVGELIVTSGTEAAVSAGFPSPGDDEGALYADRLVVDPGATLFLGDMTLYTRAAEIAGIVEPASGVVIVASPCLADIDGSGQPDIFDVLAYLGLFGRSGPGADIDASGEQDIFDLLAFLDAFDQGC